MYAFESHSPPGPPCFRSKHPLGKGRVSRFPCLGPVQVMGGKPPIFGSRNPNRKPPVSDKGNSHTFIRCFRMDIRYEGNRMRRTGLVYDERFKLHKTGPGHPEAPERLTVILRGLEAADLLPKLI